MRKITHITRPVFEFYAGARGFVQKNSTFDARGQGMKRMNLAEFLRCCKDFEILSRNMLTGKELKAIFYDVKQRDGIGSYHSLGEDEFAAALIVSAGVLSYV